MHAHVLRRHARAARSFARQLGEWARYERDDDDDDDDDDADDDDDSNVTAVYE